MTLLDAVRAELATLRAQVATLERVEQQLEALGEKKGGGDRCAPSPREAEAACCAWLDW
jgi:hypothetical protein